MFDRCGCDIGAGRCVGMLFGGMCLFNHLRSRTNACVNSYGQWLVFPRPGDRGHPEAVAPGDQDATQAGRGIAQAQRSVQGAPPSESFVSVDHCVDRVGKGLGPSAVWGLASDLARVGFGRGRMLHWTSVGYAGLVFPDFRTSSHSQRSRGRRPNQKSWTIWSGSPRRRGQPSRWCARR